jgi:peptidoglycan/xylan/chitin deacetylase (PgdA/CDA1 family)
MALGSRRFSVVVGLLALALLPEALGSGIKLTDQGPSAPSQVARSGPISSRTTERFAIPVLMYHHVGLLSAREAGNGLLRDLTVSPDQFERQIKYLMENGFAVLPAGDVAEAVRGHRPLPTRGVALTFDDGYADNFTQAFPILLRHNIRATVFLVTSTVGTKGHLSWTQVLAMHRRGIGFGSHGVHHLDMTHLPSATLARELTESKRAIEEKLRERVSVVAYPSGKSDKRVAQRARAAGYLAGWCSAGGPVKPGADPFELPRMRGSGSATLEGFAREVQTAARLPRRPPVSGIGARRNG